MKRQRDANTRASEARIFTRSLKYLHYPVSLKVWHTQNSIATLCSNTPGIFLYCNWCT